MTETRSDIKRVKVGKLEHIMETNEKTIKELCAETGIPRTTFWKIRSIGEAHLYHILAMAYTLKVPATEISFLESEE